MEITDKQKKIIGIVGIGVGIVGITAIGYYYYRKPKELGFDELENLKMPKMVKSRWENIDTRYEDLDDHDNKMRRRERFMVYSKDNDFNENSHSLDGKIQKRFKVLKTHGNGTSRAGQRLRVSGDIYKRTPSGYNFNTNNRNANFSDLIIP